MSVEVAHQCASEPAEDDMGFLVPRCTCGWTFGPVPDMETAIDILMAHAAERAHAEARA